MSDTRERMQEAGRAVESILPPGTGFALLAFDHNKPNDPRPSGRLDYVANGRREDVCRSMLDFVARAAEHFGKHELEKLLTTHVEVTEEQRRLIVRVLGDRAVIQPELESQLDEVIKLFET